MDNVGSCHGGKMYTKTSPFRVLHIFQTNRESIGREGG